MNAVPAAGAPDWKQALRLRGRGRISSPGRSRPTSARWRRPARRPTRCPCSRMSHCAIPCRRRRPAPTKAAAPPTTCSPSGRRRRPPSIFWVPTTTRPTPAAYIKVLDLYHREDNALYLPETGGSPRFLFFALGRRRLVSRRSASISPRRWIFRMPPGPRMNCWCPGLGWEPRNSWRPSCRCIRCSSDGARCRRMEFAGKLKATAEEPGQVTQTLHFGAWDAVVSYGIWARRGRPVGNPQPMGGALVAQLGDHQFLVSGFYSRVDFEPTAAGRHRQFLRSRKAPTRTAPSSSSGC